MKKILSLLLIITTVWVSKAQCNCSAADVVINSNYSSYTFLANTSYCIDGNVQIQWTGATFQDNVTLCISPGSTFRTNDLIGNADSNVTVNVSSGATFIFAGDIPFSMDVTIEDGGVMQPLWGNLDVIGTNFDLTIDEGGLFDFSTTNLNSPQNVTIINNGTFDVSNLTFNQPSNIDITNTGDFNATTTSVFASNSFSLENSGEINLNNLTLRNASTVDIHNTSLIDLTSFRLGSNIGTMNFTNSSEAEFILSSHISLLYGNSIIVNDGTITTGGEINLDEGVLNLTNNGTITTSGNFNWGESGASNYLFNYGALNIGGQMSSEQCQLEFYNYDGASLYMNNHLTYGTEGPNKFENYGNFHADGLYSNDPTLHLKNEGYMVLESNYGDTPTSVFSNCGTLDMENWFDLNGKIINTGNYNVPNGSIGFEVGASIENYSVMHLKQIVMDNSTIFYNEGAVIFSEAPNTTIKFAGPGSTYQPSHSTSSNYGRFSWPGSQSNQSGFVDGNLMFTTTTPGTVDDTSYPGMFGQWTSVTFGPDIVFGTCSTCTVITDYDQCANADGTWPSDEPVYDCIPVNRNVRSYFSGSYLGGS
ncbi:hypothetical protein [Neptunitalea lumnitzerae]|uniref:Uncharacterized protein n=1 Tax=Neptunitalea lumnitzerae TaxID=2965509 RepID=A0ABQ5MM95_9FLAO|nr:hypothetical protein [Neptunitalea sp. Y10]GLB50082.1 hypothetical protein Y10_24500 [Neptunitalea sp. Y10]